MIQATKQPRGFNMKKNNLTILIILAIFLASALPSSALMPKNGAIQEKIQERETVKASRAATKEETQLTKIKERANKMIENRLTSLNKLLTRIQNEHKLSAEDKNALIKQVEDAITVLNALKTKISNDSDTETVRADAKSIVADYKIFVMFEPKIRLLVVIDSLQNISSKMSTIISRLQTLIDEQKASGQNVTSLQKLVDDINARLQTINTKLTDDKTKLNALTAKSADYKTVLTSVRQDLASVRAEFAKVRNDIAQIRSGFKKLFKISPTPTVTTTP